MGSLLVARWAERCSIVKSSLLVLARRTGTGVLMCSFARMFCVGFVLDLWLEGFLRAVSAWAFCVGFYFK